MLTTQVQVLGHEIESLVQRHVNRDLTKAEIVRQLATEGCVLTNDDKDLHHLNQALHTVVEMAVDYPQTVDMKPERDNTWAEQREAWERLMWRILRARDEALDRLNPHRVAGELVSQAMVALQPDDEPVLPCYRRAYDLLKQATEALRQAREEAA